MILNIINDVTKMLPSPTVLVLKLYRNFWKWLVSATKKKNLLTNGQLENSLKLHFHHQILTRSSTPSTVPDNLRAYLTWNAQPVLPQMQNFRCRCLWNVWRWTSPTRVMTTK